MVPRALAYSSSRASARLLPDAGGGVTVILPALTLIEYRSASAVLSISTFSGARSAAVTRSSLRPSRSRPLQTAASHIPPSSFRSIPMQLAMSRASTLVSAASS